MTPAGDGRAGRALGRARAPTAAAMASSRAAASAGSGTQMTLPSSMENSMAAARARQTLRLRRCRAARSGAPPASTRSSFQARLAASRMPGTHALPGERRHQVGGITGQEDPAGPPPLGVAGLEGVHGVALQVGRCRGARPTARAAPRPGLLELSSSSGLVRQAHELPAPAARARPTRRSWAAPGRRSAG